VAMTARPRSPIRRLDAGYSSIWWTKRKRAAELRCLRAAGVVEFVVIPGPLLPPRPTSARCNRKSESSSSWNLTTPNYFVLGSGDVLVPMTDGRVALLVAPVGGGVARPPRRLKARHLESSAIASWQGRPSRLCAGPTHAASAFNRRCTSGGSHLSCH
jgi:hypothetical protein